jgi:hypothetical protein
MALYLLIIAQGVTITDGKIHYSTKWHRSDPYYKQKLGAKLLIKRTL